MLKINGKEVIFFVTFLLQRADEATFDLPFWGLQGRFKVTQATGDFQISEQRVDVHPVENELVFSANWVETRPSWTTDRIPLLTKDGELFSFQVARIMTQGAMSVQLYLFHEGKAQGGA